MQRLAFVNHINNFIGFQIIHTHFDGCNIRHLISIAAIALNQNNRRFRLIAFFQADNCRAVINFRNALFVSDFNNFGTGFMRIAFTQPQVKMGFQFIIVDLNRINRHFAQMLPCLAVFGIAVLQFSGDYPCLFLGGFIFFAADIGFFIESRNIINVISFGLG